MSTRRAEPAGNGHLAVHALVPARAESAAFLLVHGAANSAVVWTFWQRALADAGFASYAVDLRGHGASPALDLSRVSMLDYAEDVRSVARQLAAPLVLMGWSMGGLVAMMASDVAQACIGLAPSTPAASCDDAVRIRAGEFDAAEYGITSDDPDHQPAMPDLMRDERIIALSSLGRESRSGRDRATTACISPPST